MSKNSQMCLCFVKRKSLDILSLTRSKVLIEKEICLCFKLDFFNVLRTISTWSRKWGVTAFMPRSKTPERPASSLFSRAEERQQRRQRRRQSKLFQTYDGEEKEQTIKPKSIQRKNGGCSVACHVL